MSTFGCAIRRGFFVLRPCQNPAIAACAQCGRPVCAEHGEQLQGTTFCVECLAKAGPGRAGGSWPRASLYDSRRTGVTSSTNSYIYQPFIDFTPDDRGPFDQPDPATPDDRPDAEGGSGFSDS